MSALKPGTMAPDFSLPTVVSGKDSGKDGGNFSLQAALKRGPALAVFFKISCPTCQYTFPYLERLHQAHGDKKITIVGISQNNQTDTARFLEEYGVTFRTLIDDPDGYAVSNSYGLTNVPTLFLIAPDGKIEQTSVGWVKQEVEEINQKLAAGQQALPLPIFRPGEAVSDFRAG